jgi:hypothetical protein
MKRWMQLMGLAALAATLQAAAGDPVRSPAAGPPPIEIPVQEPGTWHIGQVAWHIEDQDGAAEAWRFVYRVEVVNRSEVPILAHGWIRFLDARGQVVSAARLESLRVRARSAEISRGETRIGLPEARDVTSAQTELRADRLH